MKKYGLCNIPNFLEFLKKFQAVYAGIATENFLSFSDVLCVLPVATQFCAILVRLVCNVMLSVLDIEVFACVAT